MLFIIFTAKELRAPERSAADGWGAAPTSAFPTLTSQGALIYADDEAEDPAQDAIEQFLDAVGPLAEGATVVAVAAEEFLVRQTVERLEV